MTARRWNCRFLRLSILAVLTALLVAAERPAAAGDLAKLDTSLKLIPADAAFYASVQHPRDRFEAIKNSNALAKVLEMPIAQLGQMMYNAQLQTPGSKLAEVAEAIDDPDNKETVELLVEMVSSEIFVYGDKDFIELAKLVQNIDTAQGFASLTAQITGETEEQSADQIENRAAISVLAQNTKAIRVPNMVVGFRLKNVDRAKKQLAAFEKIVAKKLDAGKKSKGRFKTAKVGDHECLVLTLDGSMIPWDELPLDSFRELEAKEGDFQKIVDRIKELKCVIAVCVRDNYLLVSIGSSLEALEKLGKGDRLIDRAEIKPLAKFVDKRLAYVGYTSAAVNELFADERSDVHELLKLLDEQLPTIKLNDEQKERLRKDVQSMARDIESVLPKPSATVGLAMLTGQGVELYQYSWGGAGDLDGSQPLSLLEHTGGNPLAAAVLRGKVNVKNYDLLTKWVKIGHKYFKDLALPAMSEKDRKKSQKLLDAAIPLCGRLDKVNREMLLPSLGDGQTGFVLDAKPVGKLKDDSPTTEKPAQAIEPALLFSISDPKLLTKAMEEYREIVNATIAAARQAKGDKVPAGIELPKAKLSETPYGKIYSFEIEAKWRSDHKIAPSFAFSDKLAVLSATPECAERLLKSTPPTVGGALTKPDRPLVAAAWIHWADFLDAAKPWVGFAVDQFTADGEEGEMGEEEKKGIVDQANVALDVLKVLRNVSLESYLEDGALVLHLQLEIRDVEK